MMGADPSAYPEMGYKRDLWWGLDKSAAAREGLKKKSLKIW